MYNKRVVFYTVYSSDNKQTSDCNRPYKCIYGDILTKNPETQNLRFEKSFNKQFRFSCVKRPKAQVRCMCTEMTECDKNIATLNIGLYIVGQDRSDQG